MIRIIYFSTGVKLVYEIIHRLPVMHSPYSNMRTTSSKLPIGNLKSPCMLTILYYKNPRPSSYEPLTARQDSYVLSDWIGFITLGLYRKPILEKLQKNSLTLILYSGHMKIEDLEKQVELKLAP